MDSPPITEQQLPPQQQKNQTFQDKHQNEEEFKAAQASRRSRKDIQGRDFVCGCGKKYLSYPALYTHIKTKHEGRQPEGTMKYSTTAPAKKSKTKIEQQHLSQLISLVMREDLKLMDLLAPKFVGSTPLSARLKSKILQKPITDTYHALLKTTTSPLKVSKQNTLQQHLVAWLIGVGQHITQKLHDQYQWFARTVKECYYQMGGQVYNKCFSKKDSGLCYVPHFKVEKVKYFPLICDFYIRFFLPYEYSELNANLMELILTDFCHWLNRRKCTFIQIILNKEYKLMAPLKIEEDVKNDREKDLQDDDEDRCDISEMVEPESNNKEEQSKEERRDESNAVNGQSHIEGLQNQLLAGTQEKEALKETPNSQKVEESQNQVVPDQAQNSLGASQLPVEQNQNNPQPNRNWSLQPEPAAQSSQEIPQQQAPGAIHEQRVQSDVPQHEHMQVNLNNNEDAQSEKL